MKNEAGNGTARRTERMSDVPACFTTGK